MNLPAQDMRRHWGWELLAIMTNLICLILVIVLLNTYDSKPIFFWHGISLNIVVSLISTLGRVALLFAVSEAIGQWKWILFTRASWPLSDLEKTDFGNRGASGCVAAKKWRALLPLGVLVTMLALALDPFAQQLIQFSPSLNWSDDTQTDISRAIRYSQGTRTMPLDNDLLNFLNSTIRVGSMIEIDFNMKSAIQYGVVQSIKAVTQQTTFNCPSLNCTWESFESLAVCSACNDLRDKVLTHDDFVFLNLMIPPDQRYAVSISADGRTSRLPNGLLINNPKNWRDVFMTSYGTGNASETVSMQENDSLIWAMTILRMGPSLPPNDTIEALECGLFYCVKQYKSDVMNGQLIEEEVQLNIHRDRSSWIPCGSYELESSIVWTRSELESLEYNNLSSNIGRTDLMYGDGYSLSQAAVLSISKFFKDEFAFSETFYPMHADRRLFAPSSFNINGWYTNKHYQPAVMKPLYESSDLKETFRTIARSMTNALRAHADDNPSITGKSGTPVTLYRVEWAWITPHVVLFLAGIILLASSVYETENSVALS